MHPALDHDIVIVTRNRTDALEISIPLLLSSERKPRRLIVIDSSDDHGPIKEIVEKHGRSFDGELFVEHTGEPGITRQRNLGLKHVISPVVFYPDDDSLVFPNTIEEMMRVYEADEEGVVAGVCSAEAFTPPAGTLGTEAYQTTFSEKVRQLIAKRRFQIERKLFPDPFLKVGLQIQEKHRRLNWFEEENVVVVEWMTGFRMSYRTDTIRRVGFNEAFDRYCLFEDVDASFAVADFGLIVGARKAEIYHHKYPARRDGGFTLGFTQILNKAYVIHKYSDRSAAIHRAEFTRWARYKVFQYWISRNSSFGRDRHQGAKFGMECAVKLFGKTPEETNDFYRDCVAESKLR